VSSVKEKKPICPQNKYTKRKNEEIRLKEERHTDKPKMCKKVEKKGEKAKVVKDQTNHNTYDLKNGWFRASLAVRRS